MFLFLMIRRQPRYTQRRSSAASDVYKRQGKTELAKSLAVIYFGSESKMIRFDMTEYQDVALSLIHISEPTRPY